MTLYSTTALPSLDLISGVENIQRLLLSHTAIAAIGFDNNTLTTVAVLKTEGTVYALQAIRDTLVKFDLPFIQSRTLTEAIRNAKNLAHNENVVEFQEYRLEDSSIL